SETIIIPQPEPRATHSAGPWQCDKGRETIGGKKTWDIHQTTDHGAGNWIATFQSQQVGVLEGEENARLGALIPEMLDVCERSYKEFVSLGMTCDCENLPMPCLICSLKKILTP